MVCGEYEWLNKSAPHTLTATYHDNKLKKYKGPPRTLTPIKPYPEDNLIRWFIVIEAGWIVKTHKAPWYQSGVPWYMLNHTHSYLKNMAMDIKNESSSAEANNGFIF